MELDKNTKSQKAKDQDELMPWMKHYPTQEEVIADLVRRRSQGTVEPLKEIQRIKNTVKKYPS